MPTPAASGSKKEIFVTVRKVDGRYVADGGGMVDRIGEIKGNHVTWHFHNSTTDLVEVKLHKFSPSSPCPIDAPGCAVTQQYPPNHNQPPLKAKLNDKAGEGIYNYEILVTNVASGDANAIDPELQIDGKRSGAKIVAIGIAVALAVAALWFLTR